MKIRILAIAGTMAVILGISVYFGLKLVKDREGIAGLRGELDSESIENGPDQPARNSTNVLPTTLPPFPKARFTSWADLESEDYLTYLNRLREFGCPEKTVLDIILANLDETYQTMVVDRVRTMPTNANYWTSDFHSAIEYFQDLDQQLSLLQNERAGWINSLFGAPGIEALNERLVSIYPVASSMAFLDDKTRESLNQILPQFEERSAVLTQLSVNASDDVRASLHQWLHSRKIDILESSLTTDQMFEFYVRFSETSESLRSSGVDFIWSENEFRDVFLQFHAQGLIHEKSEDLTTNPLTAQILEQSLGESRYQEFTRSKDSDYIAVWNFMESLGISTRDELTASTRLIFGFISDARKQIHDIWNNPSFDKDTRLRLTSEIQKETDKSIRSHLGNENMDNYLNDHGKWISDLTSLPYLASLSEAVGFKIPGGGNDDTVLTPTPESDAISMELLQALSSDDREFLTETSLDVHTQDTELQLEKIQSLIQKMLNSMESRSPSTGLTDSEEFQ